jgi:hypothetical protein
VIPSPLRSVEHGAGANQLNDDRLDHLSDQVTALQQRMDDRFDRLQFSMIVALGSILAAFGGALVAIQV